MRFLCLLISLFFTTSLIAQVKGPTPGVALLLKELARLENDPDLKHGQLGFCVEEVESGSLIAHLNKDKSLVPASSLKLLTTAAAYGILGPQHTFQTWLEYDGAIENGTLRGNIFIRGGGDPSLGSPLFKGSDTVLTWFAKSVKAAGINSIEGAVIADPTFFPAENPLPGGWIWADIGNYFGTGVYGLNYRENAFDIIFSSSAPGDATRVVKLVPDPGVELINKVTAGGSGDNAYIFGGPYSEFLSISGTIPANRNSYEVSGALPDPALLVAKLLSQELNRLGISATKGSANLFVLDLKGEKHDLKRKLIAKYDSPVLEKIIYWTNMKSHNMFAETLLRNLAAKAGKEATVSNGVSEVKKYFQEKGVNVSLLNMTDGSGLSRSNTLTAEAQVRVLRSIRKEPWFEKYLSSHHVYQGSIQAKSGYMNKVRSYAGYVKTPSGTYAFSVIANNYTCSAGEMKDKLERLLAVLKGI